MHNALWNAALAFWVKNSACKDKDSENHCRKNLHNCRKILHCVPLCISMRSMCFVK